MKLLLIFPFLGLAFASIGHAAELAPPVTYEDGRLSNGIVSVSFANNAVCIQRLVHATRPRQSVKTGGGRKIFQVNQMETSLVELRAVRWRPAAPFGAVPRRISVRVAIPQTKEARQKSLMQIHKIPVNLSTADVATIAELAIKWR